MLFRRMYILLLFNGLFYICLLVPFDVKYGSSPMFPFQLSVWIPYPLLKVGYFKSPTIIVLLSIYPFKFVMLKLASSHGLSPFPSTNPTHMT